MADTAKKIYVYMDWENQLYFMGSLYVTGGKGRNIYSFEYDEKWFESSPVHHSLDPDLSLYRGRQYAPIGKKMFGLFSDSCPDRWGRLLMNRREAIQARKEERKPKKLTEAEYLLGVYDESRMGALRFSLEKEGEYLANDQELAAPPWTTLRQLETASLAFERDESGLEEKWLKQLLAPGSSLGGARPKATVQDPMGNLWIAKFPSKHDTYDSGKWEMVAHDLALECGLNVPEAKLEQFSDTGSTFLVKRFDREGKKRIHFASSMTLLGKIDGDSAEKGTGYPDLADFLKSNGAAPREDLRELWKRMVFNMAVSNTDDHLRNHGYLLDKNGWRLSPVYDVNPCIYGDSLSLNVSETDNSLDYTLAIETSAYYGLSKREAIQIVREISETVRGRWESVASGYGISRENREYMRPAFTLEYT